MASLVGLSHLLEAFVGAPTLAEENMPPLCAPNCPQMSMDILGQTWSNHTENMKIIQWVRDADGFGWNGIWWLRVELNHRPHDYESYALTS